MIRLQSERGQIIVTLALLLPMICGCLGLILDVGSLYHRKRVMQTAADAGAMAAAQELRRKRFSEVTLSGRSESAENGFDQTNSTVTVNNPPQSGPFAGDVDFVEVTVDHQADNFFMPALGFDDTTISVRAVAGLIPGGPGCIYVLDGSSSKALDISSGSSVQGEDCCVQVNSSNSEALSVTSSSTLTAQCVGVVGNYDDGGGTIDPEPETGVSPASDPLADIPPPDDTGPCDFNELKIESQVTTLSPGIYCGGISVESGSQVTFQEGTYIIRGGGLRVTSGSSIEGTGVGFYNTSGGGNGYAPIEIQSGSDARLSAPTSGPMEGFLFFQDRDAPTGSLNNIQSDSGSYFEGTLYFPTQQLRFHSNATGSQGAAWSLVVARTLEVSSGSNLQIGSDFGNSAVPSPIKRAALVE